MKFSTFYRLMRTPTWVRTALKTAKLFMSPRNDVNRLAKVPMSLGRHQHNIALDSEIAEKESAALLKCHKT